ncbi:MAG: PAS domain-containing protein [Anaerolineae bacterium]|nr:PAS domain-containing protein [Anaerolineae bacterium]
MYQRDLLYAILLLFSAFASFITITFSWQRRTTPGALPLIALMLGTFIWSLTYAIHWLATDPAAKQLWLEMTYFGVVLVPSSFLVFTLVYSQRGHWLNFRILLVLALVQVITLILLWTDSYHGLFFAGKRDMAAHAYHDGGPWFWGYVLFSYAQILLGMAFLFRMFFTTKQLYRRQVGTVILATMFPWIASIISFVGTDFLAGLDLPPLAFVMTGIVFTISLLRVHLLDIVPIARGVLVENMNDAVLVLDVQNRVVDINPAAQRLLSDASVSARSLLGQSLQNIFPQLRKITESADNSDAVPRQSELALEGASVRYFEVQTVPLYDRSGRFSGRLMTCRDISERKQAELEREQLIADLDAYAHTVAHDLKVPVTAIIGFAELLLEMEDELTDEVQHMLERVHQASYKLHAIINELLLLASIRSVAAISLSPLNTGLIITEVMSRLEDRVKSTQARIIQPEVWPTAIGYGPWVEEIWANYISNAIKYGGSPPEIRLDARLTANGMVRFIVHDNGPGLTAEDQEKLFQRHERLGTIRAEGHGLGLSIVRRIAEKLGGEVGVESEIGKGSAFYFTLPAILG